jgi:hypothetical protein
LDTFVPRDEIALQSTSQVVDGVPMIP